MSALDHPSGGGAAREFRLGRDDRKLAGVCAGLGDYFGIAPMLVRIAFVLGTICGAGVLVPIYLAIWLIAD